MANELTTVFIPLIDEARKGEYAPAEIQISSRANDSGVDVQFTSKSGDDKSIYMIAPGEVFFVPADTTVALANGPEVSAPADRNVVVVHILSTMDWTNILSTTGQPVAEWWALEGVQRESFEALVDSFDLNALAGSRNYNDADALRDALLAGAASINVLLMDETPVTLGVADTENDEVSMGIRTWARYGSDLTELEGIGALATLKQLAPTSLNDHPVVTAVLSDVATSDVTINVRFVYWETKRDAAGTELNATSETDKGDFKPVPTNSKISIQKQSAGPTYATIAEETVIDNGQVALTVSRADLSAVNLPAGESLLFRVDVPANTRFETQYQHEQTPRGNAAQLTWGVFNDAWLTEGRSTTDETIEKLDFLVALENTAAGSVDQPLEYYAGIPVFIQVQYPVIYVSGAGAAARFEEEIRKAPKGIQVDILDGAAGLLDSYRTDEHGQIWGMLPLGYDSLPMPFEVVVRYQMRDNSISLLPLEGEVVQPGEPTPTSYSSSRNDFNSLEFSGPLKSSLGKPLGAATATALATMQVGFVSIPPAAAVSEFASTDGRHAGVMHALHQLRYVHQWFHYLTQGFTFGTEADGVTPKDESWAKILENHDNGNGTSNNGTFLHNVHLPKVRVTTPIVNNESVTGEAAYDMNDVPDLRWWLILYGFDAFKMYDNVRVTDPNTGIVHSVPLPEAENQPQFWRGHTIWHEFTHAVMNMALERLFNLDTAGSMTAAKDGSTSGQLEQVIFDSVDPHGVRLSGGWSTFEEGLAAIPEVALIERATGKAPHEHPAAPAAPRHVFVDIDAAGAVDGNVNPATDLNLSQGTSVDLNQKIIGSPALNDRQIGLRVPIAFTWALWSALQDPGGFSETLNRHVTGTAVLNDLTDAVAYMNTPASLAQAQKIFQALIWGPLIAMRPDRLPAAPPPQWNDLTGPANGPTTYSMMQAIQTNFWAALSAGKKAKIKELFEDADNPVSYYLWFGFP